MPSPKPNLEPEAVQANPGRLPQSRGEPMNCDQTRNWLLHSDDPRRPSAEVAGHLVGCDSCRALASQLTAVEQAWRDQPAPADSEPARLAFLNKVMVPTAKPLAALQSAKPQAASRIVRWVTAALILFAVGTMVWTLSPTPMAHASPALIEELIDWNLNLAQAPDAVERGRIYSEKEANLKLASQNAKLTPEDRELVGMLLDNGSWLASNSDPVDTAERFSTVADKLVERLAVAAKGKDRGAVDRYAKLQGKVNERGVGVQLARAEELGVLNFDKERRIEKLVLRDSKRMNTLVDLLEVNPDLSRKDIRQALNLPTKGGKNSAGLVFDLEAPSQPVAVGQPMSCTVRLHNAGPALHKMMVVVTLGDDVEFIAATGPTGHRHEGSQVIFRQLATLPRNGDAVFEINVKAMHPGVLKCRAELRAKQLGDRPVWREQPVTVNNAL
jgi:hypothetical protein